MTHTSPPPHKAPAGQGGAHGHHHHTPEELHNDDVGHEHSDVNTRAILMFAVGIAVVAIVSAAAMWLLFGQFERMARARDPQMSPVALQPTAMPPTTTASPYFGAAPQPQLVTNEPAVLRTLRQSEEQQMHQYGWVDQPGGVAHVPIDQAKKLIAERGLPSRAAGAPAALGTHAPSFGEASGGRTISTREAPAQARPPAHDQQKAAPATPKKEGGTE
jgi:hypothetical protein